MIKEGKEGRMDSKFTGNASEGNDTNIKVLMYPRIVSDELQRRSHWSCVSVNQLRRHIELLNDWGFTPITFKDYSLFIKGEKHLPKIPVIITFENGYKNIYRLAFPLLKRFGVNAVVFALGDRTITTDYSNEHLGLPPEELATDEDLIEMQDAGFEIGSHSMTHVDLTGLSDSDGKNEIMSSKKALESILQAKILSFSYPFGSINERIKNVVANAGYEFGCGIDTGPSHFGTDMFDIRRITMTSSTNTMSFAVKMLTRYEHAGWMSSKVVDDIRENLEAISAAGKYSGEVVG